jgi:uncharacterized protein YndB with AHSA1/START domain
MTDTSAKNVVFKREFHASVAEVYEAWTSPGVMQHWLAPGPNVVIEIEADLRVDGAFLIRSKAPDGAVHTIRGIYRELMPGQRIAMTWTYTGPVELICKIETLIEIDLRVVNAGRTSMTFTQSRFITQDVADAYEGDWPSCFDKLTGVLGRAQQKH